MKLSINHWVKSLAILGLLVGLFFVETAHPAPAIADQPEAYTVYAPFGCTVGDDCDAVGSGQLVRSAQGVTMNIETTDLDNAAYTVWWIVFNNPEFCSDPCNLDDLAPRGGDPQIESSVLWATGHVVGEDGQTAFAAHLQEGKPSGEVRFGPGLTNVAGAEVHLVVRSHGPAIPGRVYEQISTFAGGCDVNICEDHQFAIPD